jgi:hypothetical protein
VSIHRATEANYHRTECQRRLIEKKCGKKEEEENCKILFHPKIHFNKLNSLELHIIPVDKELFSEFSLILKLLLIAFHDKTLFFFKNAFQRDDENFSNGGSNETAA